MAKNKSDSTEQPKEEILIKKVDEMMDIKRPETDVSKIAATFNEKFLSQPAAATIAAKTESPKTAPELPSELKADDADETIPEPEPAIVAKPAEVVEEVPAEAEPEPEIEPIIEAKPETDTKPNAVADDIEPEETFDDQQTDQAVDDIVSKEADVVLAVEDAQRDRRANVAPPSKSLKDKLKGLGKNKLAWIVVALLLIGLFAVPVTRYKLAGLVIKKSVTITVMDSKTATPVSNADVNLGGETARTDANGKAVLRSSVGNQELVISKKFYTELRAKQFVGFTDPKPSSVKLTATGRLVPITVLNKITGKPVSGAQIKVLGSTAKTDATGLATVALPISNPDQPQQKIAFDARPAKVLAKGYNSSEVTIQLTDQKSKANIFELTPSGQIYFLSNRSGKLDVVRTNLDGTGRKTVVEGTGSEDVRTTSLLASRDWRYIVLKSRREAAKDALYLIDTATDKLTKFDSSEADFTLVGWYDHSFIYALTNNNRPASQSGQHALKSYDAETQQLSLLDQNQAEGDTNDYTAQSFSNFYIVKGAVVYNTQWYNYGTASIEGKNDTVRTVSPNGQNKKDHQLFPTANIGFIQASLYEPQGIYYAVYDKSSFKTSYYIYEDQKVDIASIEAKFDQPYPTFLLSPNGNQTFWSELRDGKNTLFTGDAKAESKKQIASSGEYAPYGWYTDNYNLVSKNSSELYIMSPKTPNKQLKITDYYKPAQTYPGYGYGYGGL